MDAEDFNFDLRKTDPAYFNLDLQPDGLLLLQ